MKPLSLIVAIVIASTVHAEIRSEPIEYKAGDLTMEGLVVYDDAIASKRPVVLVVHEWWGFNDYARGRARQLAEMGYVAFAVDMYGKGVRAANVDEARKLSSAVKGDRKLLRQRINAALDAIREHARVDGSRTAVIGYCFGGTVALELARSGADIRGAVSFHGALDTPDPRDARNIKGKVLVCHGGDDPFVPDAQVAQFNQEMKDAKVNYQLNIYGGAVHTFTNPDAAKANLPGVAYHEQSDKRSWEDMKSFFREIFSELAVRG